MANVTEQSRVDSLKFQRSCASGLLSLSFTLALNAQPALQIGALYQCAPGRTMKVLSCAGNNPGDSCDMQLYTNGQPGPRGPAPHQQVMALLNICHLQTPAETKGGSAAGAPAAGNPAMQGQTTQPGVGGFKAGDTVQINTAFGWINAKVLRVNGNNYFVHADSGAEVWKPYPTEVRRIGPINEIDRANGVYALHDRVQVHVDGHYETGEIITTQYVPMRYEVQLANNRSAWATAADLKLLPPAPAAPVAKAGTPPKPGMVSCAGKIEGRYSSTGGPGLISITFRSGKATFADPLTGHDDVMECWMAGEKIILHAVGDPPNMDMNIDINDDGTLDTPLGEIKKKGN